MEKGILKKSLQAGKPAFGCWLELVSPLAAEIVAQAGYDFVMIDCEHGPGSVLDSIALMHAVQGCACDALMRVQSNDPVMIKRALDSGVTGVMIPAVDTQSQAEAAVAACRYPPAGMRGMAATVIRAADYGASWQDYVKKVEETLLVICQIESGTAVENVDSIVGVEGLDLLFIGPFDLSANMGYLGQPDHPKVRAAISKVERAAKGAGKLLGAIATPERSVSDLLADGYDMVLADADSVLLRDGARASVARLRETFGRS